MRQFSTIVAMAGISAALGACDTDAERRTTEEEVTPTTAPPVERSNEIEPVAGNENEQPNLDNQGDRSEAAELLSEAAATLQEMKSEPKLRQLLEKSKGVFIVPDYGRGAAGIGVRGGEGVLLAHQGEQWSGPVFYDIGGISLGAQLGAEAGEIAMLLMSEQALNSFRGNNTFSLNAGANLTVVDYSGLSQASLGKDAGDVVFWSGTEGAFAGVSLSATDISWDDDENAAYYGKQQVTPTDVLSGKVKAPPSALQQQLSPL